MITDHSPERLWESYRRSGAFRAVLHHPGAAMSGDRECTRFMSETDRILKKGIALAMAAVSGTVPPEIAQEIQDSLGRVGDYVSWIRIDGICVVAFAADLLPFVRLAWSRLGRRGTGLVAGVAAGDLVRSSQELLLLARFACHQSVARGVTLSFLDAEGAARALRDFRLASAMKADLARGGGEFDAHFQPQVVMGSGLPVGIEVLARWSVQGLPLAPARFIPLAEDAGLMAPLGQLMFSYATQALSTLRYAGIEIPRVSVNVSAEQLAPGEQGDFLRAGLEIAGDEKITPGEIDLEIADSPAFADAEFQQRVRELHQAGFGIAVDNFGVDPGHESWHGTPPPYSYAAHIPVRDACHRHFHAAHGDGMETVAERVESPLHADILLRAGCRIGQGFHLGRPMSLGELPHWWRTKAGGAKRCHSMDPAVVPA